jgi:predicted hydrolase (HD superfamily)
MGSLPTLSEAYEILTRYNQDIFHLRHSRIVSGVLGYFAREYDPENVAFWEVAGLLHDLDFEMFPELHCIKGQEIMRELGLDERLVRATASHGYGITVDIRPEHIMEKILYAVDELTGLIGAVAVMRPSRSVMDLEQKSVMKKFRTEMLGGDLESLIDRTILAMRSLELPDASIAQTSSTQASPKLPL